MEKDSLAHEPTMLGNRIAALANGISEKLYREAILSAGLTPVQISILTLCEYMPDISIDNCSKALDFSHSYLVRIIEALAEKGMIERRRSEVDRRNIELALTIKGTETLMIYHQKRAQVMGDLLAVVLPGDQNELSLIVAKMLRHFPEARNRAAQICRYCDMIPCHEDGCPTGSGEPNSHQE